MSMVWIFPGHNKTFGGGVAALIAVAVGDSKISCQGISESIVICLSCRDLTLLTQRVAIVGGSFLGFVLLERCLPCQVVQDGPINEDPDHRLSYKLNGYLSFWITLSVLYAGWPLWHPPPQKIQFTAAPRTILLGHCLSLPAWDACFYPPICTLPSWCPVRHSPK